MANSKSAEKRARQNKKRYELKHAQRSMMRTAVKRVEKAVETKDKNKKDLANKGVIHKNKAARLKSRLSKKIKAS